MLIYFNFYEVSFQFSNFFYTINLWAPPQKIDLEKLARAGTGNTELVQCSLAGTPEGHSAMDKALTCHAGGRGLNQDTTKDF